MNFRYVFVVMILMFLFSCENEDVFISELIDFEELELDTSSYWNGSVSANSFFSGSAIFYNTYLSNNNWSGFAYSNLNAFDGYEINEKMCFAEKEVSDKQNIYLVGNCTNTAVVEFPDTINGVDVIALQVINTLYLANVIKYGNEEINRFGGNLRDNPDWLKLCIKGIGIHNECTGIVDFFLADFRFDKIEDDYLIEKWRYIDLRKLSKVKRLEFSLSSSKDSDFADTFKYFCIDNMRIRKY